MKEDRPQVDPKRGHQLIHARIGKGKEIRKGGYIEIQDYENWRLVTKDHLEKSFGRDSPNVAEFMSMSPANINIHLQRENSLLAQLKKLEAFAELLETEAQLAEGSPVRANTNVSGHRIFLVHGHDDGLLHEVARFLERMRQEVIILREQPSSGRTIIEKFEDFSDVGFAVVLLTPDDRGGKATAAYQDQIARARQNVIFELGYFLGRLGRTRVCALFKPGLEIPSDYQGVLYVPIDENGSWRLSLARELKAAGLSIDMNLAV